MRSLNFSENWFVRPCSRKRGLFLVIATLVVEGSFLGRLQAQTPTFVGRFPATSDMANEYTGVAVQGNKAFIAHDTGLRIIDITDLSHPAEIGSYTATGGAHHYVAVSGNYAFLTGGVDPGLEILDISDPANPRKISSFDIQGDGDDIVKWGDFVLVAAEDSGLEIINVADPTTPRLTAAFKTGNVTDVAVSGTKAYLVDGISGLHVVDLSDPANPRELGAFRGAFSHVAINGEYAFLALPNKGIQVLDATDPAKIRSEGMIPIPGGGFVSATIGEKVLIGNRTGLATFNFATFNNPFSDPAAVGDVTEIVISGHHAFAAVRHSGLWIFDISQDFSTGIHLVLLAQPQGTIHFIVHGSPYGMPGRIERTIGTLQNWTTWKTIWIRPFPIDFFDPIGETGSAAYYRFVSP